MEVVLSLLFLDLSVAFVIANLSILLSQLDQVGSGHHFTVVHYLSPTVLPVMDGWSGEIIPFLYGMLSLSVST